MYKRLEKEGRLFHNDWSKYNTGNVVFKPKQMTPEELQEGYDWFFTQSFSWRRIFKRASNSPTPFYSFIANVGTRARKKDY